MAAATTAAAETLSPALMSDILALPAATAPPGMHSNFVDPPSDLSSAIATIVVCTTITLVAVFVRVWTKGVIMRSMMLEDYVIILGWLLFIGEEVPASIALNYGNGADEWNVSLRDFSYTLYTNNLTMILYCLSTLLLKISVLLQYLRIFVPTPEHNRVTFYAIWATMIALGIYYITMTGFLIGLCSPREKIWNIFISTGSCFNVYTLVEASGILNIISDVVIFVLPLSCVWQLQMRPRKKLAVSAVFGIGVLAIVASCVRCYYSFLIASTDDETYVTSILGIWAAAECTIGIVVTCAPVFPRFYDNMRPKIYSVLSYSTKRSASSGSSGSSTRIEKLSRRSGKSSGTRRMGKGDAWGESLFEVEKGTVTLTSTYHVEGEEVMGSQGESQTTVSTPHDNHTFITTPARIADPHHGVDLERGDGEIWRTTSVEVNTRPVSADGRAT